MILPAKVLFAVGEYYIRRYAANHKTTLDALNRISGVHVHSSDETPPFEKDKLLEKIEDACGDEYGFTASAGHFFFRDKLGNREEMNEHSWPNFIPVEKRFFKHENQD